MIENEGSTGHWLSFLCGSHPPQELRFVICFFLLPFFFDCAYCSFIPAYCATAFPVCALRTCRSPCSAETRSAAKAGAARPAQAAAKSAKVSFFIVSSMRDSL